MTNNKIKMAEKNGIPNPVDDMLKAAKDQDLGELIAAIMAMDDDTFDRMSDGLYASIEKTFNSVEYRNNISTRLNLMTDIDFKQEKEGYDGMINMIDDLASLSENKKKFMKYLFDNAYASILQYEKDPSEHIKVIYEKLNNEAIVPTYAHLGDAGADLYAVENCMAKAGEVTFVHTGIALKIPKGYEGQIRPRSGMSAKTKIRIANAPGTIDSNYRGEICVLVDNYGSVPYMITKGDRIAQIVFNKIPTADFEEGKVETEDDNSRGEKGFGSSGSNLAEKNNGEISS